MSAEELLGGKKKGNVEIRQVTENKAEAKCNIKEDLLMKYKGGRKKKASKCSYYIKDTNRESDKGNEEYGEKKKSTMKLSTTQT